MKRLLVLIVSMALLSHLKALEAEFSGTELRIVHSSEEVVIKNLVDPHCLQKKIYSVQQSGTDYYVVYASSEYSKGWPARGGMCGAGVESWMEWLHIADGVIQKRKFTLYESCVRNRDGYSINWRKGKLVWQTNAIIEGRDVLLRWEYDPGQPGKGIQQTSAFNPNDAIPLSKQ